MEPKITGEKKPDKNPSEPRGWAKVKAWLSETFGSKQNNDGVQIPKLTAEPRQAMDASAAPAEITLPAIDHDDQPLKQRELKTRLAEPISVTEPDNGSSVLMDEDDRAEPTASPAADVEAYEAPRLIEKTPAEKYAEKIRLISQLESEAAVNEQIIQLQTEVIGETLDEQIEAKRAEIVRYIENFGKVGLGLELDGEPIKTFDGAKLTEAVDAIGTSRIKIVEKNEDEAASSGKKDSARELGRHLFDELVALVRERKSVDTLNHPIIRPINEKLQRNKIELENLQWIKDVKAEVLKEKQDEIAAKRNEVVEFIQKFGKAGLTIEVAGSNGEGGVTWDKIGTFDKDELVQAVSLIGTGLIRMEKGREVGKTLYQQLVDLMREEIDIKNDTHPDLIARYMEAESDQV